MKDKMCRGNRDGSKQKNEQRKTERDREGNVYE